MNEIDVIEFLPEHKSAFKKLNEDWIQRFFHLEEDDLIVLNNPEMIIQQGGFIFVALYKNEVAGVCALKKWNDDRFELAKFAVNDALQGHGIGKQLLKMVFQKANNERIKSIFLEGNTKLSASIYLYRKFGFREIPLDVNSVHYERVDVLMEWNSGFI